MLGLPSAMAYLGWTAGTIVMVLACELPQDAHMYPRPCSENIAW